MHVVAEQMVMQLGAAETKEYRVVTNNVLSRQQLVYHPQLHVMAGPGSDVYNGTAGKVTETKATASKANVEATTSVAKADILRVSTTPGNTGNLLTLLEKVHN